MTVVMRIGFVLLLAIILVAFVPFLTFVERYRDWMGGKIDGWYPRRGRKSL